jgi:hypothetical protein
METGKIIKIVTNEPDLVPMGIPVQVPVAVPVEPLPVEAPTKENGNDY